MNRKASFARWADGYGGSLQTKRRGRIGPRPVARRQSMHIVLRSTLARGAHSMRRGGNPRRIESILRRFSAKYHVKIYSMANVGNHLHLHVQFAICRLYPPWIRAVTGAIAMALGATNRWRQSHRRRFWDRRPYSRVVTNFQQRLRLKDYIEINQYEGLGFDRSTARYLVKGTQVYFFNSA